MAASLKVQDQPPVFNSSDHIISTQTLHRYHAHRYRILWRRSKFCHGLMLAWRPRRGPFWLRKASGTHNHPRRLCSCLASRLFQLMIRYQLALGNFTAETCLDECLRSPGHRTVLCKRLPIRLLNAEANYPHKRQVMTFGSWPPNHRAYPQTKLSTD